MHKNIYNIPCDFCKERFLITIRSTSPCLVKFCSKDCRGKWWASQFSGPDNFSWKGDKVSYYAKHIRLSKKWGKPKKCEHCRTTKAKRYEWANKSGEYNYDDKDDWLRLCRSCHVKYDRATGQWGKKICE